MSKSLETKYSQQEFLDIVDEIDGMTVTLQDAVDSYIDGLGDYITGNRSEYRLEGDIDNVVYTLEMVYDSLDSFDEMIEEENLVARIEIDNERGVCDLEESMSYISDGIYHEVESFRDVLTLLHYIEEGEVEADQTYIGSTIDVGAPTQLVADQERLKQISRKLDQEDNRIIFGEILARRHTSSEDSLQPFEPEPPIFHMLGHEDHANRVNRLNKEFKKNQ